MDIPSLLDTDPGGGSPATGTFAQACAAARVAVGTMRELAASGLPGEASGGDLVARIGAAAALAREVDLVLAQLSREADRRSDVPGGGVVRREGHRSAADLVATATGGTRAEAGRLIEVGRALEEIGASDGAPDAVPPDSPPPPRPAPRHPLVAGALSRGEISADCGTQIMTMLDSLPASVPAEHRERAERDLIARASGMSATRFAAVVRRFRARLDVAQHTRDLARMRERRSLRIWENRDGMLELHGQLDPETGAPLRAALDALVGDAMRRSKDSVGEDTRTTDQMRADSLAALARHGLGCTATDLPLSTVTVVVRVDEKDLHAGLGLGEVDGTSTPVDVATVRRMAADAHVIPAVLGSNGELLDFGRRRRLFTRSQRLALGERDGGCAFCGAALAWTDAHHIRWWGRDVGRTDLANGVLLCGHCHTTVHTQGWEIRATATEVWFVPPASVDPEQRPRPGGRARFDAPRDLGGLRQTRGVPPSAAEREHEAA
ncbi:HNH endonuclease signature motif containing protein [Demequina iriomotensis]|uniref:HNH endonuclease signature motif containing protein n=1 Tax=Demequina iriomotensis TaxID=1536641 RepID=UPI0007806843|nr:HNH endonuclease signature motif containing protein [Demequina iriomotensis]